MSSISIYYTARRAAPLTNEERAAIERVREKYSVEERILERERTRRGPNWESFCIYKPDHLTEPGVIFEGATGLPDNSEAALAQGLAHWCAALSEIRLVLPRCEWSVAINEWPIPWDEAKQQWDPWETPRASRGWIARLFGRSFFRQ